MHFRGERLVTDSLIILCLLCYTLMVAMLLGGLSYPIIFEFIGLAYLMLYMSFIRVRAWVVVLLLVSMWLIAGSLDPFIWQLLNGGVPDKVVMFSFVINGVLVLGGLIGFAIGLLIRDRLQLPQKGKDETHKGGEIHGAV